MRREHEGQGLVEYGLILLMVALVVVGTLALLGPEVERSIQVAVDGFP